MTLYALSLKQPWAALLVHGRKTIEVRRWATKRRGPVLIHAARVPDPRPEAWAQLPPELREAARAGRRRDRRRRPDRRGRLPFAAAVRRRPCQAPQRPVVVPAAAAVRIRLRQRTAAAVPSLPRQRPFLHRRRRAGEAGMTATVSERAFSGGGGGGPGRRRGPDRREGAGPRRARPGRRRCDRRRGAGRRRSGAGQRGAGRAARRVV